MTSRHVTFHLVGRGNDGSAADSIAPARWIRARVGAMRDALTRLGQQVSVVDGDAPAPATHACDVAVVVPVGPAATAPSALRARLTILWVDRMGWVDQLDAARFDAVYVAWAHLRSAVLAWSGLPSDRVLTTGLGAPTRSTTPTPVRRDDARRVLFLAGSEPAVPIARDILGGLHEHDERFAVEILDASDDDDLDAALAGAALLVVSRSGAEAHPDVMIRARQAGVLVVAATGEIAAEVMFPDYDGVLVDEEAGSPAFAKACEAAIVQFTDEPARAAQFRARAMDEPLAWERIAREWVAHWTRTEATRTDATPRVSVVIGVHNEERYVGAAVESILGQTVWDLEVLVVNDGSTDATADILRRYRDARLRVIEQDNAGLWAALNRGLRDVRSPLVARMDGDDVTHPRRLQYQLDFLDAHPRVALVGSACYKIDAAGRILSLHGVPTDDRTIKSGLARCNQFVHPTVVMRRTALERVGDYRRHEAEDYELFLRISERFEVANLDRPLHRLRRTGMTRTGRLEREINASVTECADEAQRRCLAGIRDLRWAERRAYARTLHAVASAMRETDRSAARRLFARAVVLAPDVAEHWRSWARAWLTSG
jgi:hypothetical protein